MKTWLKCGVIYPFIEIAYPVARLDTGSLHHSPLDYFAYILQRQFLWNFIIWKGKVIADSIWGILSLLFWCLYYLALKRCWRLLEKKTRSEITYFPYCFFKLWKINPFALRFFHPWWTITPVSSLGFFKQIFSRKERNKQFLRRAFCELLLIQSTANVTREAEAITLNCHSKSGYSFTLC